MENHVLKIEDVFEIGINKSKQINMYIVQVYKKKILFL